MDLAEVNQSGVTKSSTASSESSAEVSVYLQVSSGYQIFRFFHQRFFSRALKRQRLALLRAQADRKKALLKVPRSKLVKTFKLV